MESDNVKKIEYLESIVDKKPFLAVIATEITKRGACINMSGNIEKLNANKDLIELALLRIKDNRLKVQNEVELEAFFNDKSYVLLCIDNIKTDVIKCAYDIDLSVYSNLITTSEIESVLILGKQRIEGIESEDPRNFLHK